MELKFYPLDIVCRYRDRQLLVSENYIHDLNGNVFQSI